MRRSMGLAAAVAALVATAAVIVPAAAQEGGDLDCGDPGTSHNMPIDPADDPHGLDADGDGIGCEDPAPFGGTTEPAADDPAEPAAPVRRAPSFTG